MNESAPSAGLMMSLRRLLSTFLELGQVRLELLGNELKLEKLRLFDALLWAVLALLAIGVGLVLLVAFAMLLLDEAYRLPALGALVVLFLGTGVLLIWIARERLQNHAGMFAASAGELARDRIDLVPGD